MRQKQRVFSLFLLSPSSRRAWIEIGTMQTTMKMYRVALLTEGVDRNGFGGVQNVNHDQSPSSRRAWIEI